MDGLQESGFSLLARKTDFLPLLIGSSRDCIQLHDLDGSLLDISRPGLEAFDIDDFSSVAGFGWLRLWPDDQRRLLHDALATALSGEKTVFEAFCPTLKGVPKWWEVSVLPIHDSRGGIYRILSFSRDITTKRQLIQSLQTLVQERDAQLASIAGELAREAARLADLRGQISHTEKVRLLGEFVAHIVHDMNNVLSVMASSFRIIRRKAGDSIPDEVFRHGEEAIEHGARVVRQLLDFARGGEDKPEAVEIAPLIREWEGMLGHLVGPRITVNLAFEPDLPSATLRTGALQSVLFNLCANARDAMPEGGVLTVGAGRSVALGSVQGLRLFVRDTGSGMPPEVMVKAGEPFFSTKERGKGTGLGLASAFEFARAAGGKVQIESAEGVGTTISMILPIFTAEEMVASVEPAVGGQHGHAVLLVVEEDTTLRNFLANALRSLNYSIIEARSLSMALGMMVAHPEIDLVLSNTRLDGGFPYPLFQPISGCVRRTPVLMWGDDSTALAAGASTIALPMSPDTLARRVLEALGRLPGTHLPPWVLRMAEQLSPPSTLLEGREALRQWRELAVRTGRLPHPDTLQAWARADGHTFKIEVVRVDQAPVFRYLFLGEDIPIRMEDGAPAPLFTGECDDGIGSLASGFKSCEQGVPHLDETVVASPTGTRTFERLLLPLSADGDRVTHLLGFAVACHLPSSPRGTLLP